MITSSKLDRNFWFILGLSTFLALVGCSVSIWSIGSLKYQIEYSKSLEDKLISFQKSCKDQNMVFKKSMSQLKDQNVCFQKSMSQLNSTFKRQNKNLGEHFTQVRSTVHQLAS